MLTSSFPLLEAQILNSNSRNDINKVAAALDEGQYDVNEDIGTCSIGSLKLSPPSA